MPTKPPHRPELRVRAEATREHARQWSEAELRGRRDLLLSPAHTRAFAAAMQQATAAFDAADGDRKLLDAIVAAEHVAQLARLVVNTRRDPAMGALLQLADLCAADGYAVALAAAGHDLSGWTPPVVIPEAAHSALTYTRDMKTRAPSLAGAVVAVDLDVPVVLFPPDQLPQPWTYTTLQHEVGHDLAADLGLNDAAAAALKPVVRAALGAAGARAIDAPRWAMELLADTLALVLGGPAFGVSLARVLRDLGSLGQSRLYPGTADRLAFNAAVLRELGDDVPQELAAPGSRDLDDDAVQALARGLLALPVETGDRSRRRRAAPSVRVRDLGGDRAALHDAIARLQRGDADLTGVPWRALPAAAQLRLGSQADEEEVRAVARWAVEVANRLDRPAWAKDAAQWAFLAAALNELDATWRVDGRKVLSRDLLTRHDRVAFVGATQHSLPTRLSEGLAQRGGRRWRELEVFVLSDAQLGRLYPHDAAGQAARADEVIAALREILPRVADAWSIYRYDTPWMFGSFWDWEELHGRIHTSSHVWGQDLGVVPGLDLIRTATPSRDYLTLADGLIRLREEATLLGSGFGEGEGAPPTPPPPPAPPPPGPQPPRRRGVRIVGAGASLAPTALSLIDGEPADPIAEALRARGLGEVPAEVEPFDITVDGGPHGLLSVAVPLELAVEAEPDEHVLVLVQDADGLRWVVAARRDGPELRFALRAAPPASDATGMASLVWGAVRAWVVRRVVRWGVASLVRHLDADKGPALLDMAPADPVDWAPVADDAPAPRRLLLFVHGTGSSTAGSFRGLAGAPLGALRQRYDAVWGFEHATLGQLPTHNAAALRRLLHHRVGDAPLTVDVVGFSRGGLVITSLLADELTLHPAWSVERAVFVACPLAGTELARHGRWLDYANALTQVAGLSAFAPPPLDVGLEVLGWAGDLVLAVSAAALDARDTVVPGVEAMNPAGGFLAALHTRLRALDRRPKATVIRADADQLPLAGLARHGLFGGLANDLVVDVPSMQRAPGSPKVLDLPTDRGVYHLTYFFEPLVQHWLDDALS